MHFIGVHQMCFNKIEMNEKERQNMETLELQCNIFSLSGNFKKREAEQREVEEQ